MIVLDVAQAFGAKLHGRAAADGAFNGAAFRTGVLAISMTAAARESRTLLVDFDGVASCTGGFCEAAFGDLVDDEANDLVTISMTLCLRGTTKTSKAIVENAMRCMSGAWKRREDAAERARTEVKAQEKALEAATLAQARKARSAKGKACATNEAHAPAGAAVALAA